MPMHPRTPQRRHPHHPGNRWNASSSGGAASLELPDHDYWLFDSRRAGRMTYDANGNVVRIDLVNDPNIIVHYCSGRDVALHYAIPLTRYLGMLDCGPGADG